jgi:hypothetical protein
MATDSHKRNLISSLTVSKQTLIIDHERKANILWYSLKSRLGIIDFSDMVYNLIDLLQGHDLEHLQEDFSIQDIHNVIKAQMVMLLDLMDLMVSSLKNVGIVDGH